MSEDAKTQLVQEAKQIEADFAANPERAAIWVIEEYRTSIGHIIARAKEHLSDQDFESLLHEIKTSPKTAKSLVEDLSRTRYFDTVIEPIAQRWASIFEQINRTLDLYLEDEELHYVKMLRGQPQITPSSSLSMVAYRYHDEKANKHRTKMA